MDNLSPILQRIPQLSTAKSLEVQELSGGITNRNYKISADGECFVLRLGGNETRFLGIDRKTEYECSLLASQIGIAPEPIAFLEPEGYILARFISGKGIPAEEIGVEQNIRRVLESMKAYHKLSFFPGSFSPFRVAEEYAATARKFNVQLPVKMDRYLEISREIEKAMYGRNPLQPRPCHNDLLNGNFIDDGTRVRILDWEYAGMGDMFFDLGNFAIQHEFDEEQDEMLLRAYFGIPTDSRRAHHKLMKIMSDLREAMWSQVQLGVSKLDFDYAGYGQKYFNRFEASTNSADYDMWLNEM
ncbi:MAG TPA: phosphotransferase [Anaerolineales bacterium]|nr:phosphotransferase [Anaerolineales bacterium]